MRRLAVIDLGSNSWRLVVFSFEPGLHWELTDEIREPVRVVEGMAGGGRIRPEPFARALATADVFAAFCEAAGVHDVVALATSAIRDAANGAELLGEIGSRTGFDVRLLGGQEEARYGYVAVANSTTLADGFGLDVGGGSVQMVRLARRRLVASASWPLGAVRMTEAFVAEERPSRKRLRTLARHVRETLSSAGWPEPTRNRRIVGTGGTIRNLAAAAQKRAGEDALDIQGFLLERGALEELIEELAGRSPERRGAVPGIKPDRGDVILAGATVLAAILDEGRFEGVEVTEAGLREGAFFERLLAPADPPLFDDVRRESVRNLANRFRSEPAHVAHVAHLAQELYYGLAAEGLVREDDAERELLWAACMLHDVGMAIRYDDHHKHSEYLIRNAGLPGFTPREVALVARVARYHRKGTPNLGDLEPVARSGDERRLALLAGLVRLAEQLERSRDQSVREVRVSSRKGELRIGVEAGSDGAVAVWSARQGADLLAELLSRRVSVEAA